MAYFSAFYYLTKLFVSEWTRFKKEIENTNPMAKITQIDGDELTIEVKVKITGTLFESEQEILDACNEVGNTATGRVMRLRNSIPMAVPFKSEALNSQREI